MRHSGLKNYSGDNNGERTLIKENSFPSVQTMKYVNKKVQSNHAELEWLASVQQHTLQGLSLSFRKITFVRVHFKAKCRKIRKGEGKKRRRCKQRHSFHSACSFFFYLLHSFLLYLPLRRIVAARRSVFPICFSKRR